MRTCWHLGVEINKKTDKKLGMGTNHSGTGTGEHSGTVKGGGRKIQPILKDG